MEVKFLQKTFVVTNIYCNFAAQNKGGKNVGMSKKRIN